MAKLAVDGGSVNRILRIGMRLSRIILILTFGIAHADVDKGSLAKFWTADALHVPYRALVTPGREGGERLPLIVFLHGAWQDGNDNESQLAGYGNGSLELVDDALDGNIPPGNAVLSVVPRDQLALPR